MSSTKYINSEKNRNHEKMSWKPDIGQKKKKKKDSGFAGVGAGIAGIGMAGLGFTTKMSLDAARGVDRVGKKFYSNQSGTIKKSDKPDIVVK